MHLIMFDIDGTLVNSSKFDEDCYFQTAKDLFGVDIPTDINEYKHATDSGILDEIIVRFEIQGDIERLKKKFIKTFNERIFEYISDNADKVDEIRGASEFLTYLKTLDNIKIALATGCWEETARLKLSAANIDITGVPIASSSDHFIRIEIMKLAEHHAMDSAPFESKSYFGDARWDLKASKELGFKFILVGKRFENVHQIDDFQKVDDIMNILNL